MKKKIVKSLAGKNNRARIIVVGQTPPPYGGQAIMVESLLTGHYDGIELLPVRVRFSRAMSEVGHLKLRKILHIGTIVGRIIWLRIYKRARILYYAPGGSGRIPIYKDMAILLLTRWLFNGLILHFHAGGLESLYKALNPLEKVLFRAAYFFPDVGIRTSDLAPPDPAFVRARSDIVVVNGLQDLAKRASPVNLQKRAFLLFTGVLRRSKGVLDLLEACEMLRRRKLDFTVEFVGEFESSQFRDEVESFLSRTSLVDRVKFSGVLTGSEKAEAYRRATVFCFPSFFEAETFGLVLVEAMEFSLPIVATRWRGIPTVVRDGFNGFLVEPRDIYGLANRIGHLLTHPSVAEEMGIRGRKLYEKNYTIESFHLRMEQVFELAVNSVR